MVHKEYRTDRIYQEEQQEEREEREEQEHIHT